MSPQDRAAALFGGVRQDSRPQFVRVLGSKSAREVLRERQGELTGKITRKSVSPGRRLFS